MQLGLHDNLQRKKMKALLNEMEKEHPDIRSSLFSSMGNLRLSHLLDPAHHGQVSSVLKTHSAETSK